MMIWTIPSIKTLEKYTFIEKNVLLRYFGSQ